MSFHNIYSKKKRLKEYDIKKYILHEKCLIAYEAYVPLFKRIFLLKKRIIIAKYRDEKDNSAMKKFSKMKDFYYFYNNEYQQISKEREKLPKVYIYNYLDLEYFEKSEERAKRFDEVFSIELNINSTANFEELKNDLNVDIDDNYEVEQVENKNNINDLYENVFEDFKKNKVNITNELYSMNRTDSSFTIDNITPDKYTEEFFYDSNNDFDLYMNTDADRGYYNGYTSNNYYDDDLINHSQPDYLNDPYVWDKETYNVFKNDNDY